MSSLNFPFVSEFVSTITKEILEKGVNNATLSGKEDINFWDNLKSGVLRNNIITFYNAIKDKIDNPAVQAAMIAVSYKESGMEPQTELSVGGTISYGFFNSFENLKIYSTPSNPNDLKNSKETSPFILELRKYNAAFYNFVYGAGKKITEFKNTPATKDPIDIPDGKGKTIRVYNDKNADGYKYRGRGYNGITGRVGYEKAQKDTGVDVITNPDLLNNPDTAAKAYVGYMNRGATGPVRQPTNKKNEFYQVYSRTPLKDYVPTDYHKAYNTLFSINAGPGKSMEVHLSNDIKKGGYNNGYFILQSIYNAIIAGEIK
jgi:hypothetical protein